MIQYYAVCNVNGPISVSLDGETEAEALESFADLDKQYAIDSASSDAENELGIKNADSMTDSEFSDALEAAGAELVRCLAVVVNANAGRVDALKDGWSLWAVES